MARGQCVREKETEWKSEIVIVKCGIIPMRFTGQNLWKWIYYYTGQRWTDTIPAIFSIQV